MEQRGRADNGHHGSHLPDGVEHWRGQGIDPGHQQAVHVMQAAVADLPAERFIGLIIAEGMGADGLQFLLAQLDGFALGQVGAEDQAGR
ncbi:hypothetical protein D9M71_820480 [compost metagenome]